MIEKFLAYIRLERNRSVNTVEAYRNDLSGLLKFLSRDSSADAEGKITADILLQADTRDIRQWLARESENGCGTLTIRRKAQAVRSFFNWAIKIGLLKINPAAGIQLAKAPKPLPVFVTPAEMQQVEEMHLATDPMLEARNHLIVELLYTCGLRQSELRLIADSDIDYARSEIRIHGKGGKTRIVPLAPSTLSKIRKWQTMRDGAGTPSEPLSQKEKMLIPGQGGRMMSAARLYQIVSLALSGTKAHRRSPHVLRHSFATAMLNGGADIMTVKEFLGHNSLSSTQIYTHLNFKQLQNDYLKAHPRAAGREEAAKPAQEESEMK